MLARIFSCAVVGLEGVIVEVEVDYNNGLPGMTIVGLPDTAVQESRECVQTAVKNVGLHFPRSSRGCKSRTCHGSQREAIVRPPHRARRYRPRGFSST